MRRPVIGIEANLETPPDSGRRYAKVYEAYYAAVADAGGFPVLLPPLESPEQVRDALELVSGLVFPGGDDVPPEEYGQEAHVAGHPLVDGLRLRFGRELMRSATARGLPVLGVCYGSQLMNVVHGGELLQDIPKLAPRALEHRKVAGKIGEHDVEIEPGSRLAGVIGTLRVHVNSSHHQASARIGEGLRVVARSPDGIVEALEGTDGKRFLLGVQWHPEMLGPGPAGWGIFGALVDAARAGGGVANNQAFAGGECGR